MVLYQLVFLSLRAAKRRQYADLHQHFRRLELIHYHLVCVIKTQDGRTPLYAACWNGHLDLAVILLERFGADVAAADEVSNE